MSNFNFQLEERGVWHQVMTDGSEWYVASSEGNVAYHGVLELPETWQRMLVGMSMMDTAAELAESVDELNVVLQHLHGTRATITTDGATVDGMAVS